MADDRIDESLRRLLEAGVGAVAEGDMETRALARRVAAFYHELVDAGVPEVDVVALTGDFMYRISPEPE